MINKQKLNKIKDYLYEMPRSLRQDMRVPGRIYADSKMIDDILEDKSLTQIMNVASMPGIYKYVLAMPDVHQGYGIPVGGVAAFDIEGEGVISPGAVGYDINCGVRLLRSSFEYKDIKDKIVNLANQIQRDVPSGLGRGVENKLSSTKLTKVLKLGARWAQNEGYAENNDLDFIEENGCLDQADPNLCSEKAFERGLDQVGTLGAGNHFIEVQRVEKIFDKRCAEIFELFQDQVVIMIHTGSRGFGHQVASDYIEVMKEAMIKYNIKLPDKELACVPFNSEEGQKYFRAMSCAANFAWTNRQIIAYRVRKAAERILGSGDWPLVYDVAHNMAKIEEYEGRKLCIHRKGATRAFGPGSKDIPKEYREVGQPVLTPGSMGTASYVLAGTRKAEEDSFGSTCHGAGRAMSRSKAKKQIQGGVLKKELEGKGIVIRAGSTKGLAEEAPMAYKDIDNVVDIVAKAGLASRIAKLVPLAVIKG